MGFVIIDNPQIVITVPCLSKLSEANVAVVVTNSLHMPVASLMPYDAHSISHEIFAAQNAATKAVNGRLWRQIVRQKIINQAMLLKGLKKDSFIMHQYSVYIRPCASLEATEVHIKRIKMLVPDEGLVSIVKITDKQFSDTIQFVGKNENPSQKALCNSNSGDFLPPNTSA